MCEDGCGVMVVVSSVHQKLMRLYTMRDVLWLYFIKWVTHKRRCCVCKSKQILIGDLRDNFGTTVFWTEQLTKVDVHVFPRKMIKRAYYIEKYQVLLYNIPDYDSPCMPNFSGTYES